LRTGFNYLLTFMAHTIQAEYKNIVQLLCSIYPAEEARAIADRLFEHFFKLSPTRRMLAANTVPDHDLLVQLQEAVKKILDHVPLQYVTGQAYFMEMDFRVNPSVLIPRPETEEMVSMIIAQLKRNENHQQLRIIDIGTGSGCIAVSLKYNLPGSTVTAVDISADALAVAAANAGAYYTAIEFIQADILNEECWETLPGCDVIVSNPPYVTHSEKPLMLPNVLNYEPHTALFVPDHDPLLFYRAILRFAKCKLTNKGVLWFEINEMYGQELRNMAIDQGFSEVNIIFDFRGKSRFLQCYKY
jgi:release factor glutamine methyltransferase